MMHSSAVLALAVSLDSELLASGSADGSVKVWQLRTGACVRRYAAAHGGGVTSCCFSRDASHVLSSSCDGTARVHGLKSGKMLKSLQGHASFVNAAAFTPDGAHIITAGADGTLRTWDARTGEPGAVLRPPAAGGAAGAPQPPLLAVLPLPGSSAGAAAAAGGPAGAAPADAALVCPRGPCLYLMSLSGTVLRALPHGRGDAAPGAPSRDFVAAALSPRAEWAFGLCADGLLCAFALAQGGALAHTLRVHSGDGLGLACHPHRNLLGTFAGDGTLRLWRP